MKLTKAQIEQRREILSFIDSECAGKAKWSRLHVRGFHYMTISAMVLQGWLASPKAYEYSITDAGRAALSEQKR